MNKKIISILIVLLTFNLCACDKESTPELVPEENLGELEEIDLSEYESIYVDNRKEAYPLNSAVGVHKAAHGYKLKTEQGYNSWYYQVLSGL